MAHPQASPTAMRPPYKSQEPPVKSTASTIMEFEIRGSAPAYKASLFAFGSMIQRFAPQQTEIVKIKPTWNRRILPGESTPQIRRHFPGSAHQDRAIRYEAIYPEPRQATIRRPLPREK